MNFNELVFKRAITLDKKVAVLGCGAVGSFVAFYLDRLGARLVLIDGDRVEPHNIPRSLYGPEDVGDYKVDALARKLLGRHKRVRRFLALEELKDKVYVVVDCRDGIDRGGASELLQYVKVAYDGTGFTVDTTRDERRIVWGPDGYNEPSSAFVPALVASIAVACLIFDLGEFVGSSKVGKILEMVSRKKGSEGPWIEVYPPLQD